MSSSEKINVKIKKLRDSARIPEYKTSGSAACDLCAAIDAPVVIAPGEVSLIPTGISVEPENDGIAILIFARSGLAVKHGICPANAVGVVDSDYRGEIMVGLRNSSALSYEILPGERIAQMMFVPICTAAFIPADSLSDTERSAGGFGHTGR